MASRKSFTFPVVAWDDVEGRDVWIGDVTGKHDDPLLVRYENEALLETMAAEIGVEVSSVYVVRSLEV